MLRKLFSLTIVAMFIFTAQSFAQNNWSIALKSSYFGDQTNTANRVTAIENPLSVGMQLQYHATENFALQYSVESLNGRTRENVGDELNVQSSLSAVVYPFHIGRFSPYVIQGFNWVQRMDNSVTNTSSSFNIQMGFGTEFAISNKLFYNMMAKMYSDAGVYEGWGTSFGLGYAF